MKKELCNEIGKGLIEGALHGVVASAVAGAVLVSIGLLFVVVSNKIEK